MLKKLLFSSIPMKLGHHYLWDLVYTFLVKAALLNFKLISFLIDNLTGDRKEYHPFWMSVSLDKCY